MHVSALARKGSVQTILTIAMLCKERKLLHSLIVAEKAHHIVIPHCWTWLRTCWTHCYTASTAVGIPANLRRLLITLSLWSVLMAVMATGSHLVSRPPRSSSHVATSLWNNSTPSRNLIRYGLNSVETDVLYRHWCRIEETTNMIQVE
jgi:hypothetical protein